MNSIQQCKSNCSDIPDTGVCPGMYPPPTYTGIHVQQQVAASSYKLKRNKKCSYSNHKNTFYCLSRDLPQITATMPRVASFRNGSEHLCCFECALCRRSDACTIHECRGQSKPCFARVKRLNSKLGVNRRVCAEKKHECCTF